MDQGAKGAGERPRPWWKWVLYALILWQFIMTGYTSFHQPWMWTTVQLLFVFSATCLAIVVVAWSFVWWRGGTPALKARSALIRNNACAPRSKRWGFWNFLFWVIIAVALVLFFNWQQQHGLG
jgi:hypothetical protein